MGLASRFFPICNLQGGYDWLIIVVDTIKSSSLLQVLAAANQLSACRTTGLEQWVLDLSKVLANAVERQTLPPTHIPSRKSDLASKVSLCVHQFVLEYGRTQLPSLLSSFQCWCTDMGTEVGISSFRGFCLTDHLPTWMVERPLTNMWGQKGAQA